MPSGRWRQDPHDSKRFIEITNERAIPRVYIHDDNVDFVSPVDGSHLRGNRQLIEHNKRNGVTNDLDSLREQTKNAMAPKQESRREIHERKLAINDAIEQASSSGYNRKVNYDE